MTPALAMITSNKRPSATSLSAAAHTLFKLARSSSINSKLAPFAAAALLTSAVASFAFSRSRAAPTTSAPCSTSARAVSMPRPAETPVTRIRFPFSSMPARTSSVVDFAPNFVAMPHSPVQLFDTGLIPEIKRNGLPLFDKITGGVLRFQKVSMKQPSTPKSARKPRSDAQRNRERILEVAKQVFTRRGADASMGEIARRAKIGPGTLYRRFATRDDLLATVYITEVEKLAAAPRKLSAELPPIEALRAWLLVFIDYIAAKKIIAPALNAMAGGPSRVFQQTTRVMEEAANALAGRAVASGDLRPDVDPIDLMRAIYGLSTAGCADDWPAKARKFVDILLQGSRP